MIYEIAFSNAPSIVILILNLCDTVKNKQKGIFLKDIKS